MRQIVFSIVFRLESAYILSLIEGNNQIELSFFWLTLSSLVLPTSLSLSCSHHLIVSCPYHASETTSLRNEVANVQRCMTFVTTDPCAVIKCDECAEAKPYHINPVFSAALFAFAWSYALFWLYVSFCDDMPARINNSILMKLQRPDSALCHFAGFLSFRL